MISAHADGVSWLYLKTAIQVCIQKTKPAAQHLPQLGLLMRPRAPIVAPGCCSFAKVPKTE